MTLILISIKDFHNKGAFITFKRDGHGLALGFMYFHVLVWLGF